MCSQYFNLRAYFDALLCIPVSNGDLSVRNLQLQIVFAHIAKRLGCKVAEKVFVTIMHMISSLFLFCSSIPIPVD